MTAPYAELDLDGIVEWYRWREARIDAAINSAYLFCAELNSMITGIPPLDLDFRNHPADTRTTRAGAGSTAPSSASLLGAPNETRN